MISALLPIIVTVYVPVFAAIGVGALISRSLVWLGHRPGLGGAAVRGWQRRLPSLLSRYLYTVGIPLCVVNFVRVADLSASVFLAPLVAWFAMGLALLVAWLVLKVTRRVVDASERGSVLLLSYIGNTSYLGFPVVLLLPQLGHAYFSWAVLYDVFGTFFGAYGLGLVLARWQVAASIPLWRRLLDAVLELLRNPSLYAFALGLALRPVDLPDPLLQVVSTVAWASIMLCLVVMGMRLQQLTSWRHLRLAFQPVAIKMMVVPLVVATALTVFGLDGPPRLVLVLQASMPCGLATLVLAERYGLNRDRVVAALGLSTLLMVVMVPIWVMLFTTW